jgi:hypothetical protein
MLTAALLLVGLLVASFVVYRFIVGMNKLK